MQKKILITGASTGIGYAIAETLAKKGECVFAGARKEKDLTELGKIGNVIPIKLDIVNDADIQNAVQTIEKTKGQLDILVNNAGIATGGPMVEVPEKILRETFEINVFGMFKLTKACFPLLLKSKGRIINISSLAGKIVTPFIGPYSMSKFAIEAYSDALRREIKPLGLSVSIIEPGKIRTPIWNKGAAQIDHAQSWLSDLFKERVIKAIETSVNQGNTKGLDISYVVKSVSDAIYSTKPKTRYLIVPHKFLLKIIGLLSDEWLDNHL